MISHYIHLQERIQLETARLYKVAGVNPLAGYLYICKLVHYDSIVMFTFALLSKKFIWRWHSTFQILIINVYCYILDLTWHLLILLINSYGCRGEKVTQR